MPLDKKLLLIAIPLVLISLLIFSRGSLEITLDPGSQIKDSPKISISSDNYMKDYPIPVTLKLRPGRHTFEIGAKGAEPYIERVWVLPFSNKKISANFVDEEVPNRNDISEMPYLSLFPKETGDYLVTIRIAEKDGKRVPAEIVIEVYHRFASPSDGQIYIDERDLAVNNAKEWLSINKIPSNIPITVRETPTNN
jgi:hypothetical protein